MIRQFSHLFERLKATEKIGAYTAHGMDCQRELSTKLETTKAVEAATRKTTVESVNLLRKVEMKNDMLQDEIC